MKYQLLPLDQNDRELLVDRETFRSLGLNPEYQPDWSHVLFVQKRLIRDPDDPIIPGFPQVVRLTGPHEFMAVHTTDGEYIYYFVAARKRDDSRSVKRPLDNRIMQFCDEVIELASFAPRLGKVNYVKCRSGTTQDMTPAQRKKKFIRDFMRRTERR